MFGRVLKKYWIDLNKTWCKADERTIKTHYFGAEPDDGVNKGMVTAPANHDSHTTENVTGAPDLNRRLLNSSGMFLMILLNLTPLRIHSYR